MLNKLTPEQRDWLLEKIQKSERSRPSAYEEMHHPEGGVFLDNVETILNQCTEEEFPIFEIELYAQHEVESDETPDSLILSQPGDYSAPIDLSYTGVNGKYFSFLIPIKKFKKFAEGCNKIVEWLNKHE